MHASLRRDDEEDIWLVIVNLAALFDGYFQDDW